MKPSVQVDNRAVEHPQVIHAMTRLRVLQVVPQLATGGTEHGVLKLMAGLKDDFEQRICAVRYYDASVAGLDASAGEPFVLDINRRRGSTALFALAKVMRDFRPHIVHSRNWGAIEAVAAARLARVPVAIHSEHGYELDMLAGLPWRRRVLRRAAYAMADAVFAVTRELRDYHARQAGVDAERIGVLYNGVDTDRFQPRPEIREQVRRRFRWGREPLVVGSVGRIVALKDHRTLLAAAELAVRNGCDVRVLLVGGGPELDRLQQYAAASAELRECVVFTGESKEIPDLLNAMDVFALPSISEGMSNTLLEAMARGVPVLATDVGGNPEVVEQAHGRLFSPRDAPALAAHISTLARDRRLCAQLGAAGRQRAIERFGLRRMMNDYRNLYLDLARRKCVLPEREGVKCAE